MTARQLSLIRAFYEEHRQGLFSYALSLTRNRVAAEDAVQAAFQKVIASGRFPRGLKPYLFRCVRNAATDAWRLEERMQESLFEFAQLAGDAGMADVYRDLETHLDRISPDERETIILKVFEGLSFREIAQVREVSINTAASWYRRGIQKLHERITEEVT